MSTNIDRTRQGYQAFADGDLTTLVDLIAPDCIWHVGGRNQLAGDYVGHDQIFGYFGKLAELTDGTFAATLEDVGELDGSGMVASLVTISGTRNGTTATSRMVELARINDAGQVAECWWFAEDQYAADEFFGPAQIVMPRQEARPSAVLT